MTITRVLVRLTVPNDPFYPRGVRAFVDIILDECFQVEGIRLIQRYDGTLHVAMPSRQVREKHHDVAHPITARFRQEIDRAVTDKYHSAREHPVLTQSRHSVTIQP